MARVRATQVALHTWHPLLSISESWYALMFKTLIFGPLTALWCRCSTRPEDYTSEIKRSHSRSHSFRRFFLLWPDVFCYKKDQFLLVRLWQSHIPVLCVHVPFALCFGAQNCYTMLSCLSQAMSSTLKNMGVFGGQSLHVIWHILTVCLLLQRDPSLIRVNEWTTWHSIDTSCAAGN